MLNGARTDVDDSLTYTYDAEDRLVGATQNGIILPGGSVPVTTSFVLDDAGERVKATQPMSSSQAIVRNWTYSTDGLVASHADTKGTTTYAYGAGDFLEQVGDPRGLTLNFEYDNLGRRTRRYGVVGGNTQDDQTFAYDLAGDMVRATVVASGSTWTTTQTPGSGRSTRPRPPPRRPTPTTG